MEESLDMCWSNDQDLLIVDAQHFRHLVLAVQVVLGAIEAVVRVVQASFWLI